MVSAAVKWKWKCNCQFYGGGERKQSIGKWFYLGKPLLRHMANFIAGLLISHSAKKKEKQTFHKAQPNAIIKLLRGCLVGKLIRRLFRSPHALHEV